MIGAAVLACACAVSGQVLLRGGSEVLDAPIVAVDIRGVEVAGDAPRVIAWDRVKLVLGEHGAEAEGFEELSERAWRARIRLARGDLALATDLFESLFAEHAGADGPTALLIAEGAARCRLAEGAREAAVEPWLVALELRRRGWKIAGDPPLQSLMDEETGLVPALAPIGVRAEVDPASFDDAVVRALAGMYSGAVGVRGGEESVERDAGVLLVGLIVASRGSDPAVRETARESLGEEIERSPGGWREAWCRAAVGESLLLEADVRLRRRGVLELLHVPARFGRSQRGLAGDSLARAGEELARQGDVAGAKRLGFEMGTRYPAHPGRTRVERAIEDAEESTRGGAR